MLIILDRDGVINQESIEYIKSPQEWIPIEGSLEAIAKLNRAGYKVVIATNQSGVGRGYYSEDTLNQIHQKLRDELKVFGGHVEAIYFCPHTPDEKCGCRKPEPGMLLQIQKDFNCDLSQTTFIGDSWRDVGAARAAGCKPILVKTGHGEESVQNIEEIESVSVYDNLAAAVDAIL
ncbi:MAG: D-glycero-beta-D-manno-heptose 1,7-bisphosphate 7-phosphatase [Gammaproteobacteria bacterium]|nr:D-glycero-beta-D-manno-heptose 1,7-bisphosphate 7-phosphatase [Gammaproteobacteria bacterium]MCH9744981.1 D-glycero-beta-D-manno-heptose 1,7-bisphosphate 7-phosphatase [Gammaproteobacteria bacterium]